MCILRLFESKRLECILPTYRSLPSSDQFNWPYLHGCTGQTIRLWFAIVQFLATLFRYYFSSIYFGTLFLNKQNLPPRADLGDLGERKTEKVNTRFAHTQLPKSSAACGQVSAKAFLKQWPFGCQWKLSFFLFKCCPNERRYESGDKKPLSTGSPHQHGPAAILTSLSLSLSLSLSIGSFASAIRQWQKQTNLVAFDW